MQYPILVTVRYSTQAYHCRYKGVSSSSTRSPAAAAQSVADKIFGEATHVARMLKDCTATEPGEWAITPYAVEKVTGSSVRITLGADGHYYVDVRRATSAAFRAHSRHCNLDDAIAIARVVMHVEIE